MFALGTSVVMIEKHVNLLTLAPAVEVNKKSPAIVFLVFLE